MESTNIPENSFHKTDSAPVQPQPLQWKAKKLLPKSFKWRIVHTLVVITAFDILCKTLALTWLSLNAPLFHFWLFDVMLFQNHGIAFGIPLPGFVSILISLGLIVYFARSYAIAHTHMLQVAALCTLLGALSNLFDRIAHGFVIDYLLLFGHSAINLSDILILTGLFLHVKYNADIN